MKLPGFFVCVFSLSSTAFADYQSKFEFTYTDNEQIRTSGSTFLSDIKADGLTYELTHYFDPIKTKDIPFTLARYLNRGSYISLDRVSNTPTKTYPGEPFHGEQIIINSVIPDTEFRLGAGISQIKSVDDYNSTEAFISASRYIFSQSLITLSASNTRVKNENSNYLQKDNSRSITYSQAINLSSQYVFYSLAYKTQNTERENNPYRDQTSLTGTIIYYPTQKLYIGARLQNDGTQTDMTLTFRF